MIHITKKSILFAFIAAIIFSACKKPEENITSLTAISVYNASPTVITYDAYLDGVKINSAALPYAGGVKYLQANPGLRTLNFNIANSTTNEISKGISLTENTYTTVYLAGKAGSFDLVTLKDGLAQPFVEGKAYVRFINLSPDAPALDLNVGTTAVTTDKAYKASSEFTLINSGSTAFQVKGTVGGAVSATLTETLVAGKFYTVIAGGLVNPANANERGLNAQIILHQ